MSDQADGSGHWQALGPEVVGLGSDNGWLVSWDYGSVGVGHKLGDVKWAGVANWVGNANWGSNGGGNRGSNGVSVSWSAGDSGMEGMALGGQMVGPSSDNGWLISWGHSSVRVGHKLWDAGQWANIGAGSKGHSGGNGGNGSMGKSKGGHSRVGGELGAGNSGRSKNSLK